MTVVAVKEAFWSASLRLCCNSERLVCGLFQQSYVVLLISHSSAFHAGLLYGVKTGPTRVLLRHALRQNARLKTILQCISLILQKDLKEAQLSGAFI